MLGQRVSACIVELEAVLGAHALLLPMGVPRSGRRRVVGAGARADVEAGVVQRVGAAHVEEQVATGAEARGHGLRGADVDTRLVELGLAEGVDEIVRREAEVKAQELEFFL